MSTTFTLSVEPTTVRACCDSCGGSGWGYQAEKPEGPFDPIPVGSECWECEGKGVVNDRVYPVEPINLANHNAALVVMALGLAGEDGGEYGSVPAEGVVEVIRTGMRIMNRTGAFRSMASPGFDLPGGHAGVRVTDQGGVLVVERMGPRIIQGEVTEAAISWRVQRILGLFREAARLGCGVHWG